MKYLVLSYQRDMGNIFEIEDENETNSEYDEINISDDTKSVAVLKMQF